MTTISFVAHPDDDLLFMNPDILSDVQAGQPTWVVYMTAGNLVRGPDGMAYADERVNGIRAAYARAARVPEGCDFQLLTLAGGRPVATNYLTHAPHVRLVYPFINAASGADNGDLYGMWHDPAYAAQPIDGRPSYKSESFVEMLRALIAHVDPAFLRILDPNGQQAGDHIDHTYAARFAAAANTDSSGRVARRMDGYFGYTVQQWPSTLGGYWVTEKAAAWAAYRPHDSAFSGNPTAWDHVMDRQQRRHVWLPGDAAPTSL